MGKSSSNVPNAFKGSSLTGQRIRGYWESHADIYYILYYFLIHWAYSKILNPNNEFCCLPGNIYLSEVSIFSYLTWDEEIGMFLTPQSGTPTQFMMRWQHKLFSGAIIRKCNQNYETLYCLRLQQKTTLDYGIVPAGESCKFWYASESSNNAYSR